TEKSPRLRIDTSIFRAFGDHVDRVDQNPTDWPDDQSERVVPLDIGCRPLPSGPDGVLVQGETAAALIFLCSRFDPARRTYEDAGVASVLFRHYLATRYGWPNDEAIMGHPLYPKGLVRADGVAEVHNSQWLKTVQLRNNLSFPRADPSTQYASMRHFVFEFKEHLFECLAPSIDVAVQLEPFDSALTRATTDLG
ncbi:MAG TPA: hypothetical protein VM711_10840, partial [Sphingomicrobium sp.]|nr:hypothetical protein [Sphingomicrobium sp.]